MHRLVPLLVLSLLGCQEFAIDKRPDPDAVPVDTDVALPTRQPDIEVLPTELVFAPTLPGCEAEPLTVTISNLGDAPLDVSSVELTGRDVDLFDYDDPGAGRIRAGESLEVEVRFTPEEALTYDRGKVIVESNDPDEPRVIVPAEGEGSDRVFRDDHFVANMPNDLVDVLFVLDTSESMSDNLAALGQAMDDFILQFLALGLDYHIGVTTMDMSTTGERGVLLGPVITGADADPAGAFRTQVGPGAGGSNTERGYAGTQAALGAPAINSLPNSAFLRTDANLAVVVISDEDDGDANPESLSATGRNHVTDAFVTWLEGLKADPDDVTFNGIVGPASGSLAACGLFSPTSASRAPQYNRAITRSGGVFTNICNLNIGPFLNRLSFVVAGISTTFTVSSEPTEPIDCNDFTVSVGGVDVPCQEDAINGFTYDPSTNTVSLHGNALPEGGEAVIIQYPVGDDCE